MFELHHLQTLQALRDTNSLKDTANLLNVSLSAVSHRIKELEETLNCTIFTRKTKPVRFTAAGATLVELADRVMPQITETLRKLETVQSGNERTFHIALECHSCYQWLLPTISEFRFRRPDIDIDLITEFNFFPLEKLKTGELDLVITGDPQPMPSLEYRPLFTYELLIGVAAKHRLAAKKFVLPHDIAEETLITYPVARERLSILKNFLTPAGIAPKALRTSALTMMQVDLAAAGRGVCCLPNWAFAEFNSHQPPVTLKMGKNGVFEKLYAVHRKEDQKNEPIEDFIKTAKAVSAHKLKDVSLAD